MLAKDNLNTLGDAFDRSRFATGHQSIMLAFFHCQIGNLQGGCQRSVRARNTFSSQTWPVAGPQRATAAPELAPASFRPNRTSSLIPFGWALPGSNWALSGFRPERLLAVFQPPNTASRKISIVLGTQFSRR